MTRYTVETLRSGQPRPYADTEREYLITIEAITSRDRDRGNGEPESWEPWFPFSAISEEELPARRDKVKKLVAALCGAFREVGDQDGREGMEAHFYPTLKRLDINSGKGEIRVLIVEASTD